jgi:hypothetical protein
MSAIHLGKIIMLVKDPSPDVPKMLLKLQSATSAPETELPPAMSGHGMLFTHLARLELILQRVRKDGFHVEYIHVLGWHAATVEDIVAAVNRWAAQTHLKVNINHKQGIFFFEQG